MGNDEVSDEVLVQLSIFSAPALAHFCAAHATRSR